MLTPAPHDSPLWPHLGPIVQRVPPVFREQFFLDSEPREAILLDGVMERIWHRPAAIRPLLLLLSALGIAVPDLATNVPTRVLIRSRYDPAGGTRQHWDRQFVLPTRRRFPSTLAFDERHSVLVEWLGHHRAVGIEWRLRFAPPATLEMRSGRYLVALGARTLMLPAGLSRLLLPKVRFAERAVSGREDTFWIEATVEHPQLGPVFGYEGTFRVGPPRAVEGDTDQAATAACNVPSMANQAIASRSPRRRPR